MSRQPPQFGKLRARRGAEELAWIQSEYVRVRQLLERDRQARSMHPEDVELRRLGNLRLRLADARARYRAEVHRLRRELFGGSQLVRSYCGHAELLDLVSGEILGIESGHPNLPPTLVAIAAEIAALVSEGQ